MTSTLVRQDGASASSRDQGITPLRRLAHAISETGYKFVTITPASHARVNARPENSQAKSLADVFGWSRRFAREAIPSHIFALAATAGVLESHGSLWRSAVRFSTLKGSLFIHSAYPTNERDAVFFGPDTYKFADAIEAFLQERRPRIERAADVCSGAGPGGVLIAKWAPDAEVLMLDINSRAAKFAAVNAATAGLANARAMQSDLLEAADGAFDLIVAHPPYLIDASARAYRHGGPGGIELSLAIVRAASARLTLGGTLLVFTGVAIIEGYDPFLEQATRWLREAGLDFNYREVDPDVFGEELVNKAYANADRIALVALTVTRRRA